MCFSIVFAMKGVFTMKKAFSLILIFVFAFSILPAFADAGYFAGPSNVYSPELAQQALSIAEGFFAPAVQQAQLMMQGFKRVGIYNLARPEGEARHVAAYSVFLKNGERDQVVIAVRYTGDGEWPLNMELMPSGNYEADMAENFTLAAQDILDTQAELLDGLRDPLFLVTGHSRGAAVANILGARLTDRFGAESVYAYTFATPRTVRGDYPRYDNIFNVINPCDLVPMLPLAAWGFERYGIDRVLPVDTADDALIQAAREAYEKRSDQIGPFQVWKDGGQAVRALMDACGALMPTVAESYTQRHAVAHPGLAEADEAGLTGSELMMAMLTAADLSALTQQENDFTDLIRAMLALQSREDAAALMANHMPGVYGAWMTAAAEK